MGNRIESRLPMTTYELNEPQPRLRTRPIDLLPIQVRREGGSSWFRPMIYLLLLLLCSLSARAGEIPISDPVALKKALKTVRPGDGLVLADGTWRDARLVLECNGSPGKPITLRAQTRGKVILTGSSSIALGGSYLVVDGLYFKQGAMPGGHVISFRSDSDKEAGHCRVTQCAIIDYNPDSREKNSYWVSLYGQSNRVDHCLFKSKNDASPVLTVWVGPKPNYHLVDHNHFATRPPLGRNGGETLRIGTSEVSLNNSRSTVESNYFEDCSGEAEYISNKSCENIYRYNTFVECQGALVLRHGNRCLVEANCFFGHQRPGTGGVRIIGEDHKIFNNYFCELAGTNFESALPFVNGIPDTKLNEYFQIKRATVAFNTFVDCYQNITFGVGVGFRNRSLPPVDCVLANNLVLGTNGPLVLFQDKPVNLRWQGNIFFGADLGFPITPGVQVTDPKLQRTADRFYRLDRTSPALGTAGGDWPFVSEDIEGRRRPAKKDIGCLQNSGKKPVRRPVGPAEVGPSWLKSLSSS
jgi:poly(beta-D-mannuronate) lyase